MTHTYQITGMTCKRCVANVKSRLLMLGDVLSAEVQLDTPQATITMQRHIPLTELQNAVAAAGPYTIAPIDIAMESGKETEANHSSWFKTYKPLLIVSLYVIVVPTVLAVQRDVFDWATWMRHFMAGFFLVFSFFKLLDLKGFAESYASYDIIARKWMGWGYTYAFIELGLGIAFLTNFQPLYTNTITFLVMSISIIGVLQSVVHKRKIQCACLGTVFNLPMSTVTIVEDAVMIAMSGMAIAALL